MTKADMIAAIAALDAEAPKGATKAVLAEVLRKAQLDAMPAGARKAAHLAMYKPTYIATTSAAGNASLHKGDDVANTLAGCTPEDVMRAAEVIAGLEPGTLAARYIDRNNGAKRMNAGNIIRARVKAGTATIDEVALALLAS